MSRWNGIEYRAPTTDLTLTDIEGAWPELVTADEMPDESDKATLDNNVARGDSVFLPTTDNHAGGLTLDEEVVIMGMIWPSTLDMYATHWSVVCGRPTTMGMRPPQPPRCRRAWHWRRGGR